MRLKQLIFIGLLFLSSMTSFAKNQCPPPAMILDNAHFNEAYYLGGVSWRLISKHFEYKQKDWFFGLGFPAPNARTPEDAIKAGEVFIKTESKFFDEPMESPGGSICFYAQGAFDNIVAYANDQPTHIGTNKTT